MTPYLQPFTAAGFLFADAQILQDVPFDPYLDYVFDGEEILYTARAWTGGYDFYFARDAIIHHFYVRKTAAKVWSEPGNKWWENQLTSNARVAYLLQVHNVLPEQRAGLRLTDEEVQQPQPPNHLKHADRFHQWERIGKGLDKYGMGKQRKLDMYWDFAGIDQVHRRFKFNFCIDRIGEEIKADMAENKLD